MEGRYRAAQGVRWRVRPPSIKADTTSVSITPTTLLPDLAGRAPTREPWTARLVHWVVRARSHRVICLVLGIWLLNGFDLTFTILAHGQGMLDEANPLANHVLQRGTTFIVLFKVGLVLFGSCPLLWFRRARIAELAALLIFTAYALLAVRWSVCFELYTVAASSGIQMVDIENALGTR